MKNATYSSVLNKLTIKLLFIMFVFTSRYTNAQVPPPPSSTDVPGAPITDWILPFVFFSLIVGYFCVRKKSRTGYLF